MHGLDLHPLGVGRSRKPGIFNLQLVDFGLQITLTSSCMVKPAEIVKRQAERIGDCSLVVQQRVCLHTRVHTAYI